MILNDNLDEVEDKMAETSTTKKVCYCRLYLFCA